MTPPARILFVALAGTDQGGVHRKLAEQLRAMRESVPDTEAVVIADTRVAPAPAGAPYALVDIPGGGFGASRRAAFAAIRDAMERHAPDLVYVRYPLYDEAVHDLVRAGPPVVFEIQTKFDQELPPTDAQREREWASRVLADTAGLVAVTPELLDYERQRAGWDIPGHVMANGADPSRLPFITPALSRDRFDVLCVASFYTWHGVDRVICGMAAEPDVSTMHLHLVGDGPALPALRELARDLGVADRVHCAGLVAPDQLTPWFERAHLGLGVLAPHRKGLRELAALKHREYALRGTPFVTAGVDVDFPADLPWMRTVESSDAPLSPRALRAFALAWTHPKRRGQIREWAERHVSWSAKIPPMLEFAGTIARAGRLLSTQR